MIQQSLLFKNSYEMNNSNLFKQFLGHMRDFVIHTCQHEYPPSNDPKT